MPLFIPLIPWPVGLVPVSVNIVTPVACITDSSENFNFAGLKNQASYTFQCNYPKFSIRPLPSDYVDTRTETFKVNNANLKKYNFQMPTYWALQIMDDCIAPGIVSSGTINNGLLMATVSLIDDELGDGGGLTNYILDSDPHISSSKGHVYFSDVITQGVPTPNLSLTHTSKDGGVLFINVTPDTYRIWAYHKDRPYIKN